MKRRVRTRVRPDGSTVSVTAFQAVWRGHPQAPDRTKAFKRRAESERHLVDVQHRLLTRRVRSVPSWGTRRSG